MKSLHLMKNVDRVQIEHRSRSISARMRGGHFEYHCNRRQANQLNVYPIQTARLLIGRLNCVVHRAVSLQLLAYISWTEQKQL